MKNHGFPEDFEADYQVHLGPEKVHAAQRTSVLGSFLSTLYCILDIWAHPICFQEVWILRIMVVLLIFLIVLLIRYDETIFIRRYNFMIGAEYLLAGLAIEGMIYLAAPSDVALGNRIL